MTTPTNSAIDAAIAQIDIDALSASCTRIDTDDDAGPASPACIDDDPDLTPQEWTELQREMAMAIAGRHSTNTAARPA